MRAASGVMFSSLIKNRKIRMAAGILAFTCLAFGGASLAQRAGDDKALEYTISADTPLEAALKAGKVNDIRFTAPAVINAFYAMRGDSPYWSGFFGLKTQARFVMRKFEEAGNHALSPERYHLSTLKTLAKSSDPVDEAYLDLLLTDSYIRYVQDLTGLPPMAAAALQLETSHWLRPVTAMEALSWLANPWTLEDKLKSIEPSGPVYTRFGKEYARLAAIPDPAWQGILPIKMSVPLKPGQSSPAVPLLRERLGLEQPAKATKRYDDTLAAAVMDFQRQSGMTADGVILSETLALLNETRKERMMRISANMERMRWLPRDLGEKYVVVNIPSATLWAVEDGQVAFEMPVIVGKPERPTPIFRAEITGMRLNPDWTVPPTIKVKDMLPKLREDANYLSDRDIAISTIRDGRRVALDPLSVDWANISNRELHQIRMVQVPGENNPLGQYRVLMPNVYNIYLHDTNHRDMFDIPIRDFSSGCMRMKDPARMAAFVLDREAKWDSARIERVVASQKRTDVRIENPIPVYAVYYSAWLGKEGDLVFGPDIYGADKKLYDILFAKDELSSVMSPAGTENVNDSQVSLARP